MCWFQRRRNYCRKGFALPPKDEEKNTCKPFNGVEDGGLFGGVTGTGCIDSQGNTFILHYSYHGCLPNTRAGDSYFESGFCRFFLKEDFPIPEYCRGTIVSAGQAGEYGQQAAKLFEVMARRKLATTIVALAAIGETDPAKLKHFALHATRAAGLGMKPAVRKSALKRAVAHSV